MPHLVYHKVCALGATAPCYHGNIIIIAGLIDKPHSPIDEGLGFSPSNLPVPILGRVWGILIFIYFSCPAWRRRVVRW